MLDGNQTSHYEATVSPPSPIDLARKYCVDDLPGATIPGSRLRPILEAIDADRSVSALSMVFLDQAGLIALHRLASGELDLEAFRPIGLAEQEARADAEMQRVADEEIQRRARATKMAARIDAKFSAMQNDPRNQKRQEAKRLKERYGLGFVEPEFFPRVIAHLRRLEAKQRLSDEDVVWMSTVAEDCWTPEVRKAHHRLEAQSSVEKWRKTGDPWAAVDASSHWRKAEAPYQALEVTEEAIAATPKPCKVRSALLTTRGGAMRDLRSLSDALAFGQEAHEITPKDFRPCTLLGAVHMELGDYSVGTAWYDRAEQLGADRDDVDRDVRAIFARVTPEKRSELRSFLLSQDEQRFSWAR